MSSLRARSRSAYATVKFICLCAVCSGASPQASAVPARTVKCPSRFIERFVVAALTCIAAQLVGNIPNVRRDYSHQPKCAVFGILFESAVASNFLRALQRGNIPARVANSTVDLIGMRIATVRRDNVQETARAAKAAAQEGEKWLATMKHARVRRLPVVGADGTLLGILSMNDILLAAGANKPVRHEDVVDTLQAICAHHSSSPARYRRLSGRAWASAGSSEE